MISIFFCIICFLLLFSYVGMESLSSVRGYVGGEGLWSKSQKDANCYLRKYAARRDEEDYQKYLNYLRVPLEDKKARLELLKKNTNFRTVDQGFIGGRNHPADVRGMGYLFKYFGWISYIDHAIKIWTEGDAYIEKTISVGDSLRAQILSGQATEESLRPLLLEMDQLKTDLTKLEDDFSHTLGEGARWVKAVLIQIMIATTLIFLAAGLWMAFRISKFLVDAVKLKSEFTSTVSHELRTPMTAIFSGLELICEGKLGTLNTEQKDFLDTVRNEVDRLSRLINDILSYQKLESMKMTFDIAEHDIHVLILDMKKKFGPMAEKKGLELVFRPEDSLPLVKFDPDKIMQVVSNLLDNAIKFSTHGTVTLQSNLTKDGIRISVSDEGPGIQKEDFPKLFQSFSQLSSGEKRKGGTGLGLAISRKIMEAHGGKIDVESAYGHGSTFYFILPR